MSVDLCRSTVKENNRKEFFFPISFLFSIVLFFLMTVDLCRSIVDVDTWVPTHILCIHIYLLFMYTYIPTRRVSTYSLIYSRSIVDVDTWVPTHILCIHIYLLFMYTYIPSQMSEYLLTHLLRLHLFSLSQSPSFHFSLFPFLLNPLSCSLPCPHALSLFLSL